MPKENCQKIKLLKLMEILRQETDEQHPLRASAICARLVAQGITCDRRKLSRDIALLNEQGFEVMWAMLGHEQGYYVEMLQVHYYKPDDADIITDYDHVEVETVSITELSNANGYEVVLDLGENEDSVPQTETQYIIYNTATHNYLAYEEFDTESGVASKPILFKQSLSQQNQKVLLLFR